MTAYKPEELADQLGPLPGWEDGGGEIRKHFDFDSFADAIAFVGKVAELANRQNHHPDILIQYKKVTLMLSTHSEGGVTEKDLDLAKAISAL